MTKKNESAIIRFVVGHRQAVRHQTLTLTFPGFESLCPSQKKDHVTSDLVFFQRCLPLRASDVAFDSDVHCVSEVSPYGEDARCCILFTEGYRSGHNEAVLKTVWGQPRVSSNLTPSAKKALASASAFFYSHLRPLEQYFT